MAVMEIHVPTGYVVTNDVLRLYAQSGNVSTMHRAEAYGRKAVFYFDYVSLISKHCLILIYFKKSNETRKTMIGNVLDK